VAVALAEFATSGFEGTRVAEIASKVGVTEPVVFQNFGSKMDLFAAVLERAADQLGAQLANLDRATANVHDVLRHLLAPAHQDRLHSRGGLGVLFTQAARIDDPPMRRALQRAHTRAARAIAGLVRRGQTEGSVRADIDPVTLAWFVLSEIHARHLRRAHGKSSAALEDDALRALFQALAPSKTSHSGR
jgi:AcrR family transcriptional regulator